MLALNFTLPTAACHAAGRWREALGLLRELLSDDRRDEPVNSKLVRKVLEECSRAGAVDEVRQLVEELRGLGHEVPEDRVAQMEHLAATRARSATRSRTRKSAPTRSGTPPRTKPGADGLGPGGGRDGEAGAASRRPRWAPPYTTKKFGLCVDAFAGGEEAEAVVRLLESAIADPGVKVTMTMYQRVLQWLARMGRPDEAVSVLGMIRDARRDPDPLCFSWAIRACGAARPADPVRAVELLRQMDPPHAWGYAAAISACANGQQWEEGLSLLEKMPSVGLLPNV